MLLSSHGSATMTLSTLREQYSHHALTIRNVCADTLKARLISLDRLFGYFGPPQTAPELFSRIAQTTLTAFLLDYATRYEKLGTGK